MAIQDLAGNYGLLPDYVEVPPPGAVVGGQGLQPSATPPMGLEAAPAAAPAAAPENLAALDQRYAGSRYTPELRTAARRVESEQAAFDALIRQSLSEQTAKPSQAEMYFRLAAAFGTPTKTGSFSESLGVVGKEVSDYLKENRATESASRANRLKTLLEARKISLAGAKEELAALRTLAVEEIKALGAQSPAGKQAQDEGLRPGTPEFRKRVSEIVQTGVDARLAQVNATLMGLQLRQTESQRLTPAEVKLKTETEDVLSAADSGMKMLAQAYKLNPNTFDASLVDSLQRKALEAAGSKDPKLINTRELENLLGEQAISKLKVAFGGNPTEGERKILLDLQGIGAKSIEERARILRNAYASLKGRRERQAARLREINAGTYRVTGERTSEEGGLE